VPHISEMISEQWIETSPVRGDGKREFRERPKFGKRHVIFPINSEWGDAHEDEFNALDFPYGTLDHLSKYTEEQTSIPHNIAKLGIVFGAIIVGAKFLQMIGDR